MSKLSTNYTNDNVESNTSQNITQRIDDILKDIDSLKETSYLNKIIIFVVFPLSKKNYKDWAGHFEKITKEFEELNWKLEKIEFQFRNQMFGEIYCIIF